MYYISVHPRHDGIHTKCYQTEEMFKKNVIRILKRWDEVASESEDSDDEAEKWDENISIRGDYEISCCTIAWGPIQFLDSVEQDNSPSDGEQQEDTCEDTNPNKHTSFHFAVENDDLEMLKVLLTSNMEYWCVNGNGHTPLDLAKEKGFTNIVQVLEPLMNHPDAKLYDAIRRNDANAVSTCLTLPNVNINRQMFDGLTPLGYAVFKKYDSIVNVLVTDPNIDLNIMMQFPKVNE